MAEQEQKEKRGGAAGKVVLGAVVALVVVAGVFAATLWGSYQRIAPLASQLESDASSLEGALESYDVNSATQLLTSIDASIDAIASELDGGAWDFAAALPVLGEDVRGARTLVGVAQDVMGTTVMPLSDAVQGVSSAGLRALGVGLTDALTGGAGEALGLSGVNDLADSLASVDGALETLRSSQAALDADAQTLSGLGAFHFDELNEAREQLAGVVEELDEAIGQVTPVLESYASAKSAVSEAADTATQAANEVATAASEAVSKAADAAGQALSDAADAIQDASSKAKDFVDGAKEVGSNVKGLADTVFDGIAGN